MRLRQALLTVAIVASTIPTIAQVAGGNAECAPHTPPLAFDDRVFIDTSRAGGEPVAVVAQDGSISVSAHAGTTHFQPDPNALPGTPDFAVGYFNQTLNWRSEDGGRSWDYIGLAGTNTGPHSATSTGFSDPDFAIDQAGTIYNVEIDLANNAVFSSRDDGQSYFLAHPQVAPGDRPWVAALEPDEVFLYVNLPKTWWKSTDGGITWSLLPTPPINGKPITDPLNPDDGLIGPTGNGIAISGDDGQTWTQYEMPDAPNRSILKSIAADADGNVYYATASGYGQAGDETPDGRVTFNWFNRTTEETGQIDVPVGTGDSLWSWIVAGDDGRVAFTWLQTLTDPETGEYDPNKFYLYAAYTLNGVASDCDGDGTVDQQPIIQFANASGTPVHEGAICTGTGCNLSNGGDRRLGDFHSLAFDADGRIFLVSGDTTLRSVTNGPKPVSNPIFLPASPQVPRMLEQPMATRPTRCTQPFDQTPLCGQ